MTNSQNGNTIIREILLGIVKEYNLPGYSPIKRVFKEQSQQQLNRFVGTYDFLERGKSNIIVKDDGLEFTGGIFSNSIFLWPESDTTFFNKRTGTRYKFTLKNSLVIRVKFSRFEGNKIE